MESSNLMPELADIDLESLEALQGANLVLRTSAAKEPVVGPCATRRAG